MTPQKVVEAANEQKSRFKIILNKSLESSYPKSGQGLFPDLSVNTNPWSSELFGQTSLLDPAGRLFQSIVADETPQQSTSRRELRERLLKADLTTEQVDSLLRMYPDETFFDAFMLYANFLRYL